MFIGIDPGIHGAVAVLGDAHFGPASWNDAPKTVRDVTTKTRRDVIDPQGSFTLLRAILERNGQDPGTWRTKERFFAIIERVGPQPSFGAISNHVLGRSAATWETALAGLCIPYQSVLPKEWRTAVGIQSGQGKHAAVDLARELFPDVDGLIYSKDGRAEALLMAEMGRRMHG